MENTDCARSDDEDERILIYYYNMLRSKSVKYVGRCTQCPFSIYSVENCTIYSNIVQNYQKYSEKLYKKYIYNYRFDILSKYKLIRILNIISQSISNQMPT